MAQINIVKAFLVAMIVAVLFATTSAQELASAPAPAPDAGAAFGLAQSGAMVATSLLVSAVALLRH
ncbi:hypothetical protein RND71_004226 [Anisodus tanguticus]|uniref:Uncharacterized protein n=1 Tax=Anisodus tanguticus TaxID=243964 RepID=A0AAE1SY66_9SOLA|nr:hypothetical protein RND71_004226 [Anisodus tanguticus]